jgi:phenylacetate-CoA ligase
VSIYSFLRSAGWRLSGYPADAIKAFLSRSQHWERAQLLAYRDEKLRRLVTHCYHNVPYYRWKMREAGVSPQDINGAQDLAKLPLLTKQDVRMHAKDLLASDVAQNRVSWSRTGGTTGEPIRIAKDRNCAAWESMGLERGLEWGGLAAEHPRVRLFGGSLGLDRTRWVRRVGGVLRREVVLPAFELRRDTAPMFFERIRRSGARHLIGYASAIYRLAVLSDQMDAGLRFDAVFPTAEQLVPEWEEAIRTSFRCDVLPYYGCGEVNSLGYSIPGSRSYVVPEEHCLIEVLQDDARTRLEGDGRFVITSLVNYAMPLLRYVNGDMGAVRVASGPLPFARIERLGGRYNSLLMTETGDLISGVIGTHVFRHLSGSVQAYRIIQEEPLHVVIKIVPAGDAVPSEDEELIRRLFVRHLGDRMRITIEQVASLPAFASGKTVFVINRCLEPR